MDANRAPHPARDDGNAIEYSKKKERRRTSIKTSRSVAMTVFLPSLFDAVVATADEDASLALEECTDACLRWRSRTAALFGNRSLETVGPDLTTDKGDRGDKKALL